MHHSERRTQGPVARGGADSSDSGCVSGATPACSTLGTRGWGGRVSLGLAPFLTSKEIEPEDWARLPTCILSRLCGRKEAVGIARVVDLQGWRRGQCGSAEKRARLTG